MVINDVDGALSKIRNAVRQLAQKIVGPCALMQGALPAILKNTPREFFDHTKEILSANANVVYNSLKSAKGLSPIKSYGAMYIMIGLDTRRFPKFKCELEFIQSLLKEESVYCLPGTAFNYPGAFRIVLTSPKETMVEACARIKEFCNRYFVPVEL